MMFKPTQEQEESLSLAKEHNLLKIQAISGSGKEQPVSSIVKTPLGDKRLGDIEVNDVIFGRDGTEIKVTGVYPQGVKDVYEVTFRDGSKARCGIDHNWSVTTIGMKDKSKTKVMTLREMIDYKVVGGQGQYRMKIPLCKPVEYPTKNLAIPPYVLGAWLGDGCSCRSTYSLSYGDLDSDIKARFFRELSEFFNVKFIDSSRHTSNKGQQTTIHYEGSRTSGNIFSKTMKQLGISSKTKHVPVEYLQGDVTQRLDLLRGLMDTDGSVCKNRTSFCNTNKDIILAVKNLVQSLGGTCIEQKPDTRKSTVCYSLNVKMLINPFSCERKSSGWKPSWKNPPSRWITNIKKLDYKEEQKCIEVSSSDSLYLTDEFVVTHNTSCLKYISDNLPQPSLYLAYNRSMKEDAAGKFPFHVDCKTCHGLAYGVVGKKYSHKLSRPRGAYINVAGTGGEIANYFKIKDLYYDEYEYISKAYIGLIVKDTVNRFEQSEDSKLNKSHIPNSHITDLKERHKQMFKEKTFKTLIVKYARRLWEERTDLDSEVLCTHDTYFKLYVMSTPDLSGNYDVVYVDECQDVNAVTMQLILQQKDKCKIILVGDNRQEIYGWRGAINAMDKIDCVESRLTHSFRYGQTIAEIAEKVLDDPEAKITGFNKINSIVGSAADNVIDLTKKYTILYRTNAGLINDALEYILEGKDVDVKLDLRTLTSMLNSARALHEGDMRKVKDENIIPYTTWDELLTEAKNNRELKRIAKMVEDGEVDGVISTFRNHKPSADPQITMVTAHKSKGLEYGQVILSDCFPDVYTKKGVWVGLSKPEQNLLYVACTRAIKALQYNQTVADIIGRSEPDVPVEVKGMCQIQAGTPTSEVETMFNKCVGSEANRADMANFYLSQECDMEAYEMYHQAVAGKSFV